jgi:hypothetical protein
LLLLVVVAIVVADVVAVATAVAIAAVDWELKRSQNYGCTPHWRILKQNQAQTSKKKTAPATTNERAGGLYAAGLSPSTLSCLVLSACSIPATKRST